MVTDSRYRQWEVKGELIGLNPADIFILIIIIKKVQCKHLV